MIRVLLGCLGLCAVGTAAFAQQAGEAERRWFEVTLEPAFVAAQGTYVGGEIVLHVQFISSDPFKRVRLALPAIEGVRSTVLARPHTRQVEVLDAEGYSTLGSRKYSHETRLAIVPERSGTIVIPPITVTGISEPADRRGFEFTAIHPERVIIVHPESPDFAGAAWIVSHRATMEDSWSHAISDIRNGDTVRRTVALSVAGMAGDDLPELVLDPDDGHRVLSTEVSARTETTDHGLIAHLEQSWDIYIETEDVTHISGIRFPYWNPELGRTADVTVPPQRVEPLKRDAVALRQALREEAFAGHQVSRLGLMGLLAAPMAALTLAVALLLWRALPTTTDVRFWRASRQDPDPLEFYGAFLTWGRDTFGARTPMGRAEARLLGSRASDQVERLHRAIFGPSGGSAQPGRIARTLILGSRRRVMQQFLSAIPPAIAGFLFLRRPMSAAPGLGKVPPALYDSPRTGLSARVPVSPPD